MSNSSRKSIEAIIFKPASGGGGFVFQAPKPWLFGKARNYLVNEAQKAEILTIMAPDMPMWRRVAIIGAVIVLPVAWILGVTALMWAISPHDEPTGADVGEIVLFGAVPALLGLFLAVAWTAQVQLAKLAPLIAQLAPTEERITPADQSGGVARSMSFGALLAVILLFGASALFSAFALGMEMMRHAPFRASTALIIFNLMISLGLITLYSAMALRKARQRPDT